MDCLLQSEQLPYAGALVGPPDRRFELVERILPAPDPRRFKWTPAAEPTVWRACDVSDGEEAVVKIVPGGAYAWTLPLEAGEGGRLWRIAGYDTPQLELKPLVPSPHPGQAHCVRILDMFPLPDPSGFLCPSEDGTEVDHRDAALVLERLGPSLPRWQLARADPKLPLKTVKTIIRQVLLALDYLHTEMKLSHLALTLDDILLVRQDTAEEIAGDKTLEDLTIKLVSFGWGRPAGPWRHPFDAGHYHPLSSNSISTPEHCFMHYSESAGPADAHDIWAVGVAASRLLFNQDLSSLAAVRSSRSPDSHELAKTPFVKCRNPLDDEIVNYASLDPTAGWPKYVPTSGDPSPDYEGASRFPCASHSLSCNGVMLTVVSPVVHLSGVSCMPNIRERVEATQLIPDSDLDSLVSHLRACWTLNPFKRTRAKELLAHEWLRGVE